MILWYDYCMSKLPKGYDSQREYAEQLKKEAAVEKAQERFKDTEAELDAAYGEVKGAEETPRNKAKSESDWEQLRAIAKTQFPEGAEHLGLSPKNRLVAIAHCLGWTHNKIAKQSGISKSTVTRWLKRPDIVIFMDEFNMKRGAAGMDVMAKFTELEYKAVMCVDKILSSKDDSDAIKRLQADVSKWVFERTRGKPNQPVEHRGDSVKALSAELSKLSKNLVVTDEEEEEIFKGVH